MSHQPTFSQEIETKIATLTKDKMDKFFMDNFDAIYDYFNSNKSSNSDTNKIKKNLEKFVKLTKLRDKKNIYNKYKYDVSKNSKYLSIKHVSEINYCSNCKNQSIHCTDVYTDVCENCGVVHNNNNVVNISYVDDNHNSSVSYSHNKWKHFIDLINNLPISQIQKTQIKEMLKLNINVIIKNYSKHGINKLNYLYIIRRLCKMYGFTEIMHVFNNIVSASIIDLHDCIWNDIEKQIVNNEQM